MNLFGKKKKAPEPVAPKETTVDTIRNLRLQLETLEKREAHIGKKVDMALEEATQKARAKDKRGALYALKRKKMFEAEVMKLQGAKITLESQVNALESAVVNIETFHAMKRGADTLKLIRGNLDSDRVDDLMDEMQDEKDVHDQISDAISRGHGTDLNDDELEDELNALMALDLEESEAAASQATTTYKQPTPSLNLPSVPTSALKKTQVAAESEEEIALRELQAAMYA